MFNNTSDWEIHGGSYYNVAGDANISLGGGERGASLAPASDRLFIFTETHYRIQAAGQIHCCKRVSRFAGALSSSEMPPRYS